jgi:hypothetical protein
LTSQAPLDQLARGLAKEVALQKGAEDMLLFGERKRYLQAVQDALAGAGYVPLRSGTEPGPLPGASDRLREFTSAENSPAKAAFHEYENAP